MDKMQTLIYKMLLKSSFKLKKMQLNKKIYNKSPKDLVTDADFQSQKIIIEMIKQNFSDHKIYSEETEHEDKDLNAKNCWIVDPLDGTNNYAYGLDLWGISIAYAKNSIVQYGGISFPALNTILLAKINSGSYKINFDKNGKILKKIRLHVSSRELKNSMVLACYGQGENLSKTFEKLKKLHENVFHVRHLGAAVYELGYVATAAADAAVLFKVKPYDIAAGALIIQEAGGKITKLDGTNYSLDAKAIIASNKKIHSKLVKLLNF